MLNFILYNKELDIDLDNIRFKHLLERLGFKLIEKNDDNDFCIINYSGVK